MLNMRDLVTAIACDKLLLGQFVFIVNKKADWFGLVKMAVYGFKNLAQLRKN